jgi:triacylglycerol lipase
MWSSLSPARRRALLGAATIVLLAVATGVTIGLRSGTDPVKPVSQQVLGPVILVPGYGGSITGLDSLAVKLQAAGRTTLVLRLPGNGTGDLRLQAQTLAKAARAEIAQTHASSVDVVGYSAGGVVTRLWIRDDGGAGLVRRVVTLGSPQHGTEIAALAGSLLPSACPVACQQLASGSSLLAGLNAGDETPTGPTYVSIFTTDDTVVLPPQSAELAGALNITVQSVCGTSTVNHTGLPTDPLVQAMVLAELATGPPVPLNRTDCGRLSS